MTDKSVCTDEILKCCVLAVNCPRGSFYPNKNFGSKIKTINMTLSADELLAYARQAISDIDGAFVKNVCVSSGSADFIFIINDEEREVNIKL